MRFFSASVLAKSYSVSPHRAEAPTSTDSSSPAFPKWVNTDRMSMKWPIARSTVRGTPDSKVACASPMNLPVRGQHHDRHHFTDDLQKSARLLHG